MPNKCTQALLVFSASVSIIIIILASICFTAKLTNFFLHDARVIGTQEVAVGGVEGTGLVEVPHTDRLEVGDFLVLVFRPAHVEVEGRK